MKQNKKKPEKFATKTKSSKSKNSKIVDKSKSSSRPPNDDAKTPKESAAAPKASKQHNNPKFKTELCRSVLQGSPCTFGDQCIFVHECDDMYREVAAKAREA